MSKGLRNIPESQRLSVALRRTKNKTNGNGYWSAVDYLRKTNNKQLINKEAK